MKGKTNAGSVADLSNILIINVTSNQSQPDNDLIGAVVTVTDTSNSEVLFTDTYNGTPLSTKVPANCTCKITTSAITNYTTPEEQTITTEQKQTYQVKVTYKCCLISVVISSNQGASDLNAIASETGIKINNTITLKNGESTKVSYGQEYTYSVNSIEFYSIKCNSGITSVSGTQNANADTLTIDIQYQTTNVTASLTPTDAVAKIKWSEVSSNGTTAGDKNLGNGNTGKIPTNVQCTIEYTHVDGYTTPDNESKVFTSTSYVLSKTYEEKPAEMWVMFDETKSSTILERGGELSVIQDITSKFKRCLAWRQSDSNTIITYLNDNDSTKFPDGSTAVTAGKLANINNVFLMVHFPKYYWKTEQISAGKWKLWLSTKQLSGYKEEPECLIGAFEISNADYLFATSWCADYVSEYNSPNGFYSGIQSTYGNNFGMINYRAHRTIAWMFCAKYGNTDISTANVSIPCSGGTKAYNIGYPGGTLSLGNNDGTASVRNDTSHKSSNFLGLEDCYYGKLEAIQGVNVAPDRAMTWYVYDGGFFPDKNGTQLQSAGATNIRELMGMSTRSGFITKILGGIEGDVLPVAVSGGSDKTYYADYVYADTETKYTMWRSGCSYNGSSCGVFFAVVYNGAGDSSDAIGSRLGYYGPFEIKSKEEWLALSGYQP